MKKRSIIISAIVFVIAGGLTLRTLTHPHDSASHRNSNPLTKEKEHGITLKESTHSLPTGSPSSINVDKQRGGKHLVENNRKGKADQRLKHLPDGKVELTPAITISRSISSQDSPLEFISKIANILAQYRYIYQKNPLGPENEDITRQLLGNNDKNVVFLDQDCISLKNGQLTDKWGSPFFFHAESVEIMDIISAGPDLVLWTQDDIKL